MHATSSPAAEGAAASGNWWESQVVNPFSSWAAAAAMSQRWPPPAGTARHADHRLPPYEEPDNTTTSSSFAHETLSIDSSSAELSGEPVMAADNQIWSQLLLNIGSSSASQVENNGHSHEDADHQSSHQQRRPQLAFSPPCDYLKKMDSNYSNSWPELISSSNNNAPSSINTFTSAAATSSIINRGDLVLSGWSIAPPVDSNSCCPNSIAHHHVIKNESNMIPVNYTNTSNLSPSYIPSHSSSSSNNTNYMEIGTGLLRQKMVMNPNNNGIIRSSYQIGDLNIIGGGRGGMIPEAVINPSSLHENSCSNLSDEISFGRCSLSKRAPPMELRRVRANSLVKTSDLSDGVSKEVYESFISTTRNGRVSAGTSKEGKKKKSEESSESIKKSKLDSLMANSSQKIQVPKVKIAEKISALQQLVSPFGKTDQASVLMETITCIRILQEQVQLLSDPFLKSSSSKEHSWGEMERKEREEAKHDLRSKGLCLVPVSSIPQVHRETNRPDYWMPTYRSCLYR